MCSSDGGQVLRYNLELNNLQSTMKIVCFSIPVFHRNVQFHPFNVWDTQGRRNIGRHKSLGGGKWASVFTVYWKHAVYGLLCSAVIIWNCNVDGGMNGEWWLTGNNFEGRSCGQIEILSWNSHLLTEKNDKEFSFVNMLLVYYSSAKRNKPLFRLT
jgi:hypothetical protein